MVSRPPLETGDLIHRNAILPAIFILGLILMPTGGLLQRGQLLNAGQLKARDLAAACSDGKFVVSRTGEAYDAQPRGLQIGNSGLKL